MWGLPYFVALKSWDYFGFTKWIQIFQFIFLVGFKMDFWKISSILLVYFLSYLILIYNIYYFVLYYIMIWYIIIYYDIIWYNMIYYNILW